MEEVKVRNVHCGSALARSILGLLLSCSALSFAFAQDPAPNAEVKQFAQSVTWIDYHTVMFKINGKVVYLKPFHISAATPPKADLIISMNGHIEFWQFLS